VLAGSTHWSMLLDVSQREDAWRYFYENYQGAVTALFRYEGAPSSDVDDLVHEFFLVTLSSEFLLKADPQRGRFRAYLKTAARRFLGAERRKAGRQKRRPEGGLVGFDEGIGIADKSGMTPGEAFDLAWARSVLERGLERAKRELTEKGRGQQFEALRLRQDGASWKEIGASLGTTAGAVRGWVDRAEQTLARHIREEVSGTVAGEAALGEELQELTSILARA
jgi:RNA polymerase sigma factor (sigma-70 family)